LDLRDFVGASGKACEGPWLGGVEGRVRSGDLGETCGVSGGGVGTVGSDGGTGCSSSDSESEEEDEEEEEEEEGGLIALCFPLEVLAVDGLAFSSSTKSHGMSTVVAHL